MPGAVDPTYSPVQMCEICQRGLPHTLLGPRLKGRVQMIGSFLKEVVFDVFAALVEKVHFHGPFSQWKTLDTGGFVASSKT